jgi:hypothetical protein
LVIARASHSVWLIDHLESAKFTVMGSMVPNFHVSDRSVAELATDLPEKLTDPDPSRTVVAVQLLNNIGYMSARICRGTAFSPARGRTEGTMCLVNCKSSGRGDTLRGDFLQLQPIFKACKNFKVIVITSLPGYVRARCCSNPEHIVNSEKSSFAADMGRALPDLTVNLKDMIFMRKLLRVMMLNSSEALGTILGDSSGEEGLDRIIDLLGSGPVHPAVEAYKRLASKLAAKATSLIEEPEPRPQSAAGSKNGKPDLRDQWVPPAGTCPWGGFSGVFRPVKRDSVGTGDPWEGEDRERSNIALHT